MTTTATTPPTYETWAILSDVGPTRATVELVGDQLDVSNAAIYCDEYASCTVAPVADGVEISVGERVWIARAGQRVLRVSAGA